MSLTFDASRAREEIRKLQEEKDKRIAELEKENYLLKQALEDAVKHVEGPAYKVKEWEAYF